MQKKSIINFHHKLIMDYGSHYILKIHIYQFILFRPIPKLHRGINRMGAMHRFYPLQKMVLPGSSDR